MNIVYKIIFTKRKTEKNYPYYYIGSKSNCEFIDGKIIDKRNNAYYGSSSYKDYKEIVKQNISEIEIEILYFSNDYKDVLNKEHLIQIQHNVVISPEYFNQSYANINNYTDPDYSTMKNLKSGKICKIPSDHPEIISGEWVGLTTGRHWYNNGKVNILSTNKPDGWKNGRTTDFSKEKNSFFGKKHTINSMEKMVKTRREKDSYIPWNKGKTGAQKWSNETREKMKISRNGKYTGEKNGMFNKRFINNGTINKLIDVSSNVPEGWKLGRCK